MNKRWIFVLRSCVACWRGCGWEATLRGAMSCLSCDGMSVFYLYLECVICKKVFDVIVYVTCYSKLEHFEEYCWMSCGVKSFWNTYENCDQVLSSQFVYRDIVNYGHYICYSHIQPISTTDWGKAWKISQEPCCCHWHLITIHWVTWQ